MDNNKLLDQIVSLLEQQHAQTQEELQGIRIMIENDVSKRLEALFDGYKLTHEKQWEMERELEQIKVRLDRLESAI